jgi:serine/threonine-protein kinase HipA
VEEHRETAEDLAYLRGRGTSVNGLRPKCTLLDEDGSLAIGKFPSVNDTRAVTKAEVLTLTLAARAGIRAASGRLLDSDGVAVAMIRRFDREGSKRRFYVSAATLMGIGREDSGAHTYTEIVDVIRQTSPVPQEDIEELWRRMAFSILVNNVDDHLWNHGFLHVQHSLWRLAPAFDVNPFPDRQRELKTWISEDTGPAASIENLRSVAPYFHLTHKKAQGILETVEAAVSSWRVVGASLGMTPSELDQFSDAFEHGEREIARRRRA